MPYHLSDPLLRECVASGQVDASQIHQHVQAGELSITMEPSCEDELAQLQREIADEYARADIECKARGVRCNHPMPVYDTTEHDPVVTLDPDLVAAGMEDVRRAVRYLTLRGLLTRPIEGQPHFVSFGSAA